MNQTELLNNQETALSAQELFQKGFSLHKKREFRAAAQAYKQVLSLEPDNADAMQLLGAINAEQGQNDKAIQIINQALEIKPQMPGALRNLALAYQKKGMWDEAGQKY